MFRAVSDDGILRYCNVFHQEVCRGRSTDKKICIYPNKKTWINNDLWAALSARTSAFKSGNIDDQNKPVMISGNPLKPPNDNIKTKLKNNSTPTTQEACGRASITSQVLKGINQLLWTLPPLYWMSVIIFMLIFRLTTQPTPIALPRLLQKR